MAKRKRTSRRSDLVGRAVSVGRRALREAESRVPPELRKRVERQAREANQMVQSAIKQAVTRVRKASSRADVNSVLKRLDALTKQAQTLARGAGSRPRPAARRAASRPRKAAAATRRRSTTKAAAARRPTARAATKPRRDTTPRRRAPAAAPVMAPMMPGLEPMPGVVETGETGSRS